MRTLIAVLLTFIFVMGLTAGDNTKSIISVKGMKDKLSVEKVTKTLKSIDGVENISIELESGQVTIEHKGVDFAAIKDAIAKAGYKTNHKKSEKNHGVEAEEKSCSEVEKAGCNSPCGRKK
jgi:copper chaperone CopZ